MYLTYYGLRKEPFHITPDPEFLYLSKSHREALASMIYGIEQKKGFVAITGAVGVGKTTILRSYLEGAKKDLLKIVYVFNPRLTFKELLATVCKELGITSEATSVTQLVGELYELLIEEYKKGSTVVLVIDEAQNMPVGTLESLRMISNLETSTDKLIQIVLVGQPEFDEVLNTNRLRQLRQRVAVHSTIVPFSREESIEYMRFRLAKAGAGASSVFTNSALSMIARESGGIPRVINVWCDNALISGFGYEQRPVGANTIREVIRDFARRSNRSYTKRPRRRFTLSLSVAAMVLFGLAALGYYERDSVVMSAKKIRMITETKPKNVPEMVGPDRSAVLTGTENNAGSAVRSADKTGATDLPHRRAQRENSKSSSGGKKMRRSKEVHAPAPPLINEVPGENPQMTETNTGVVGQGVSFPDTREMPRLELPKNKATNSENVSSDR
jgi:general secretion pathway protein A